MAESTTIIDGDSGTELSETPSVRKFDSPQEAVTALMADLLSLKDNAKGQLVPADETGTSIVSTFEKLGSPMPETVLSAMIADGHIKADYGDAVAKQIAIRDEIWTQLGALMIPGVQKKRAAAGQGATVKLTFAEEAKKKGVPINDVFTAHIGDILVEGKDYEIGAHELTSGKLFVTCHKGDKTAIFSGQYPGSLTWKVKEYFGLVKPAKAAPKAA